MVELKEGDIVYHTEYGRGKVIGIYEGNNFPIHVIFPKIGTAHTFKGDEYLTFVRRPES
jgi:hypothetical protein